MSYQLVIAEKPSVARSIAGVIGADMVRFPQILRGLLSFLWPNYNANT